jgi:CheY-like chemotaxis protein
MSSECDVLIVEDDYDIREVLTEVLQDEGYQVMGGANGREALDLLLATQAIPKLILLDLMMPVMSGWQFAEKLREDARYKALPIVVVSADGNLQQKAASLGASGYLRKPIEIEALLEVVERYCRPSKAQQP